MRVDSLARLPYLAGLEPLQLQSIAQSTLELTLERGEVLFTEGEPCRGLYFVVEGSIKVSRISPEGRDHA